MKVRLTRLKDDVGPEMVFEDIFDRVPEPRVGRKFQFQGCSCTAQLKIVTDEILRMKEDLRGVCFVTKTGSYLLEEV